MQEIDVVQRIRDYCISRSWTYYRLAKESGIPYSTLSTMLHKTNVPSVPSLIKICDGLGITLAQFFSEEEELAMLTQVQREFLAAFGQLDENGQVLVKAYMQALVDWQNNEKIPGQQTTQGS